MINSNAAKNVLKCLAGITVTAFLTLASIGPAPAATNVVLKQVSIDLFQGPGTGYSIVGTAVQGNTLSVIGQKGSWSEVTTPDGTTGWIPGVLINMDSGQPSTAAPGPPAFVTPTTGIVNIRSGPGTNYSILTTVSQGDSLVVQGQSGQWYEVRTPDGILGWIAGWLTEPSVNVGQTTESTPVTTDAPPKAVISNTVTVSPPQITIFGGPGTGSGVTGVATRGTVLTVLNTMGGWSQVQLKDGNTGWIPSIIVTMDQNSASFQEPSRGQTIPVTNGAPYQGKGEWVDIYSQQPQAADLSNFAAAGVTHIYVEVATSQSGFPSQWQGWLNTLLPAAHRAGIKVIPWVYVTLANPASDAQLTSQVANYVTPLGDHPDGVAADIESLPSNTTAAAQLVGSYASLTRSALPAGMPFIAITYPPQYRPSYPFAAMGADFSAIALMDYWHITANDYNYDDTKSFVANSIAMTRSLAGPSTPIDCILQGYDNGTGLPSALEMQGALAGTSGAQGYSLYTWDCALGTPTGTVFNTFR